MSSQGAQLMVTSRMALAFRREVMRFDRQVKLLEGLPIEDGVVLLRELDPNGDYGLRDASKEQLAEAVEMTYGVPRALEVLAGILANDPFATLDEVLETFYEQEDVVQALIEENYQRLDRDARRVIEALAVFRKPVPPLAVDYLLEPFAPGLDVPSVVQRLKRTNIVSVDRAAKTVTLHPIDQDYAYSQLPEEDETEAKYTRQALERRAADYYVQLRTPEETWKSIEDMEPQLNEFEHRVRAGDYNAACKVLDFIDRDYLYLWGHYKKRLDLRERILGRLSDLKLQISNLEAVGRTYRDLGWTDQAIGFLQKAVAAAKRLGDKQRVGVLLESLSTAYRDLGKISKAIETGQRALDVTQETGNRWEESIQLGQLGTAYRLLGQFGQTVELYKDALSTAREVGNRPYEGIWLGSLGIVSCALGQTEFVEELFEDALAIAQETGNRRFEVVWLNNLGNHYLSLGETNYAINIFREALTTAQRMGYQLGKGYQYLKLGEGFLAAREFSKAKNFLIQALNLDMIEINHRASLMLDIVLLRQKEQCAASPFADTIKRCRRVLKDADLYTVIYSLSAALVGQAVCDPRWADESQRPDLLAPALEEYRCALDITAAPGVVQDAIRDLELIQAAGIEGLEPAFELLENAEYEPDVPEDLPDILEHIKSA
jgi:tetratricopeptide (TPR) repeat protein